MRTEVSTQPLPNSAGNYRTGGGAAAESDKTVGAADAERFRVHEAKKSKAAKANARKAKREEAQPKGNSSDGETKRLPEPAARTLACGESTEPVSVKTATTKPRNQASAKAAAKPTGKMSKTKMKPSKRFERFQRMGTLGQYRPLANSDSEGDDSDIMEIDEEAKAPARLLSPDMEETKDDAPYAYPI